MAPAGRLNSEMVISERNQLDIIEIITLVFTFDFSMESFPSKSDQV